MSTNMQRPRIFVVEDQALIAMDLCDRLQMLGYESCGHAGRADLALSRILESKPELVLMDVNLIGDVNGIELAEIVRQQFDVPVIFLTAYSDRDLIDSAARAEPYAFLVKPYDEDELRANIEVALCKHATDRDLRATHELLKKRQREIEAANQELHAAQALVKELRGILPICLTCKKIRDDDNDWQNVDVYIGKRTNALFSHGYCPSCFEQYQAVQRSRRSE
jgi:two-component system, response regulator PdtaR